MGKSNLGSGQHGYAEPAIARWKVAVAAQQREAVLNRHILSIIGSLPDHEKRAPNGSLKYFGLVLSRNHSANYFFRTLQFALIFLLKNRIERLIFEILLVDTGENPSGKITGHNRHRLAIDGAEPPRPVYPLSWSELQSLSHFKVRIFQTDTEQSRGRIQSSPSHLLAETTQLLKIPGDASRADDGPFAFGDHQ